MKLQTLENSITVLGALNMDLIMDLDKPAMPGETIIGHKFYTAPGGKGGNQAVAASRVSKKNSVVFLGSVGDDLYGKELKNYLIKENINIKNIKVDPNNHSGIAIIFTDQNGENYVNAVYGANENKEESIVESFKKNINNTKVLITQNELNQSITKDCMYLAKKNNIKIILDPAPYKKELSMEYFSIADIITPNETEAEYMTGIKIKSIDDAKVAATKIISNNINSCIITLGKNGAYLMTQNKQKYFPPHKIDKVEASVGAGDAFTGILGAFLSISIDLDESIELAIVGSALSVTKSGAQESMPYYEDIMKIL
jgi:ribokinase|tara:strand:+ start:420 stop:1358 length:939 start_codon:yes stop_codon:yes gene_type:complete